jgi:hypothetical protein
MVVDPAATVNVDAVSVVGSMSPVKVALMFRFVATSEEVSAGTVEDTVGITSAEPLPTGEQATMRPVRSVAAKNIPKIFFIRDYSF